MYTFPPGCTCPGFELSPLQTCHHTWTTKSKLFSNLTLISYKESVKACFPLGLGSLNLHIKLLNSGRSSAKSLYTWSESEKQQFSNILHKLQKLTSNSGCNKLANQPETKMSKLFFPFIILPPYILNHGFVVGVVKLCWRPPDSWRGIGETQQCVGQTGRSIFSVSYFTNEVGFKYAHKRIAA